MGEVEKTSDKVLDLFPDVNEEQVQYITLDSESKDDFSFEKNEIQDYNNFYNQDWTTKLQTDESKIQGRKCGKDEDLSNNLISSNHLTRTNKTVEILINQREEELVNRKSLIIGKKTFNGRCFDINTYNLNSMKFKKKIFAIHKFDKHKSLCKTCLWNFTKTKKFKHSLKNHAYINHLIDYLKLNSELKDRRLYDEDLIIKKILTNCLACLSKKLGHENLFPEEVKSMGIIFQKEFNEKTIETILEDLKKDREKVENKKKSEVILIKMNKERKKILLLKFREFYNKAYLLKSENQKKIQRMKMTFCTNGIYLCLFKYYSENYLEILAGKKGNRKKKTSKERRKSALKSLKI